jgi:hypothetical protein
MLKKHVQKYVDAVNNVLNVDITQEQFDALVSITYNIGTGGMARSTFMRRINAGASPSSVVVAMKMWDQDNGRVVKGLINRRQKESDLYQYGKYSSGMKCSVITVNPITHQPKYSDTLNLAPYLTETPIIPTTSNTINSTKILSEKERQKEPETLSTEISVPKPPIEVQKLDKQTTPVVQYKLSVWSILISLIKLLLSIK